MQERERERQQERKRKRERQGLEESIFLSQANTHPDFCYEIPFRKGNQQLLGTSSGLPLHASLGDHSNKWILAVGAAMERLTNEYQLGAANGEGKRERED